MRLVIFIKQRYVQRALVSEIYNPQSTNLLIHANKMSDHLVDIVNEKDEVIGQDLKSHKKTKWFISRAVAIFLVRSNGKFLLYKRAAHKEDAPNVFDIIAGNILQWESYANAAQREVQEEVNIVCPLQLLETFYQEANFNGSIRKIFCGLFVGVTDDEMQLNDELVEIKEMSFEKLEEQIDLHPEDFSPGLVNDFIQVKDKLKAYCK